MFFLFYPLILCYHCSILAVALCGFYHYFLFFLASFSLLFEGQDQGADRMTKSGAHMQKSNAGDEGQCIGRAMGVFPGGSERPIVKNLSFLGNMAPT